MASKVYDSEFEFLTSRSRRELRHAAPNGDIMPFCVIPVCSMLRVYGAPIDGGNGKLSCRTVHHCALPERPKCPVVLREAVAPRKLLALVRDNYLRALLAVHERHMKSDCVRLHLETLHLQAFKYVVKEALEAEYCAFS
eukprot:6208223-Pleurochrysis_carterae.AAC.2